MHDSPALHFATTLTLLIFAVLTLFAPAHLPLSVTLLVNAVLSLSAGMAAAIILARLGLHPASQPIQPTRKDLQ